MKNTNGAIENPGALQISILLLLGFLLLDYLTGENMKSATNHQSTNDSHEVKFNSRCNLTKFIARNLLRSLPRHLLFEENKTSEEQRLDGYKQEIEQNPIKAKNDYQSATSVSDKAELNWKTSNIYFF